MNIKKIRTICVAVAVLMLGAMAFGALASALHQKPSVVLPDGKQDNFENPPILEDISPTIHETYSFIVGMESEQGYLTADAASYNTNTKIRYADKAKSFVYKYSLKATEGIKQITWTSNLHGQALLEVSVDGKTWVEVYRYIGTASDKGLTAERRTFDLTLLMDLQKVRTVWIRISDSYPETGYGGAVSAAEPVVLDVAYKQSELLTPVTYSITATECDDLTNWTGNPLILETVHFLSGGTSIGGTVSGEFTTSGNVYNLGYVSTDPVDISGMQYFDFYLYVSDASLLNGTEFTVELGSCDVVDHCEHSGTFVFSNLRDGWNLMQIPISALYVTTHDGVTCSYETCADGLDQTAWKRFRVYNRGALNAGDGLTILIDHVGFSDALY